MSRQPLLTFLRVYLLTLLPLLTVFFFIEKGDVVIFFGEHRNIFLNALAVYGTYLGDGWLVGVLILAALLVVNYRSAILLAWIGIGQALMSSFLKKIVFGSMARPARFFEDLSIFNPIEGVYLHHWDSFPSGHTISAFSIAAVFVIFGERHKLIWLMIVYAWFVAWTRIYLGQHFLQDVLLGSAVGIGTTLLFYATADPFLKNPALRKSLLKVDWLERKSRPNRTGSKFDKSVGG